MLPRPPPVTNRCSFVLAGLLLFGATVVGSAGVMEFDAWRSRFEPNRADLTSTGRNPYFILEPGTRLYFRHGAETLIVSVLEATRVVDGVQTRVVEERELSNGKLTEVSRNYFAIDRSTLDVYYFGEGSDEYRNDEVVGTEGTWLAGVDGARFGLIMPGTVRVGDRYYQELAPEVAMDRAEIVAVDERVETPAGTFEGCLHVKETSPIEKGVSEKWYAPGIGLIRDEDLVLVKIERP